MSVEEFILRQACRGYIATVLAMGVGKNQFKMDTLRVEYHHIMQKCLGIRFDTEEEQKLNRVLHSLQVSINLPIPEFEGYGESTITRQEVTKDFEKLSEFYGDELLRCIKKKRIGKLEGR